MGQPVLYRKRLIPFECIRLKDDVILSMTPSEIVTQWNTLKPKKDLHHGISIYVLDKGWKISKFLDEEGDLLCWYCDIISWDYTPAADIYTFTDLLADVIIYPSGNIHVVDLDEIASALVKKRISLDQVQACMFSLQELLDVIYEGGLAHYQEKLNRWEAKINER